MCDATRRRGGEFGHLRRPRTCFWERDERVVRTLGGEEAELRCEAFDLDVPLAALYRLAFE